MIYVTSLGYLHCCSKVEGVAEGFHFDSVDCPLRWMALLDYHCISLVI